MAARRPEECHSQFAQALNSHSVESVVALYEPRACLVPDRGKPGVTGTAAIREALSGFIAMRPTIEVKTVSVLQSGEIAMLRGAWRLTGTLPDGAPLEISGNSAEVVRRQPDGSWLYVIDHPFGAD